MPTRPRFRRLFTAQPSRYWIRDEFEVAASAPLGSPVSCAPGPGLLKVFDPNNYISRSGGRLVASNGQANTEGVIGNDAVPFLSGRVLGLIGVAGVAGQNASWGWQNSGLGVGGGVWRGCINSAFGYTNLVSATFATVLPQMTINATPRDFFMVRTADGGQLLFQGTSLIWVDDAVDLATAMWPLVLQNQAASVTPSIGAVRGVILGDVWALSKGPTTLTGGFNVTPTSGVDQTALADGLWHFYLALPGSPSAGDTMELRFRKSDANNYWKAYFKRNAGNTAWEFFVDKVVAGTPTSIVGATAVTAPDAICVYASGNSLAFWTRVAASAIWTNRGGLKTDAFNNTAVLVNATAAVGTLINLDSFPLADARYVNDLSPI